jgi:hypothetical protein
VRLDDNMPWEVKAILQRQRETEDALARALDRWLGQRDGSGGIAYVER